MIKHEKERKIKSQQAIAFWGDRADVYCRFASAMLSREKVLVVDLSNSSSLIIGVYGIAWKMRRKICTRLHLPRMWTSS